MKNYVINAVFLFLFLVGSSKAMTLQETTNDIIVRNNYYSATIAKSTGMVESLKMNGSDFEIVSDYTSYSLFFVEYMYEHLNGIDSHFDCPADWDANITATVEYQDSEYALIQVLFQPGYINSEWYFLFQENQPWFSATITREVETEGVYSNFQQCTMYNPDVDNSFIINYNGDIELTMGSYKGDYPWVSPYLDGVSYSTRTAQHSLWTQFDYGNGEFYPTMAWTDNESGICMGAIVTYTSPNQRETISYHGGGSTGKHPGFAEAQWNWFGKSDSEAMYLRKGVQFSMNLIFYQNISHIDSLFSFIHALKSDVSEKTTAVEYSVASWAGRSSPLENYFWRFPQASNNTINSQELWRHKGFAVPRSQIGTHDSQLFSFDMFYENSAGKINVTPIYDLTPLFTHIENVSTDTSSSGIMTWNESGIQSELTYTAFTNHHDIQVTGSIEKQPTGSYYIDLTLSPRTGGVAYYPAENILSVYSEDILFDTVSIALVLKEGIDSVDLSLSGKIRLIINDDPSFDIRMASSLGNTIRTRAEFIHYSNTIIPEFNENYVKREKSNISFKGSENYLIDISDSAKFSLFATNNFSTFHFNSENTYKSVNISDGTQSMNVPVSTLDTDIQKCDYPFIKNNRYQLLLSKEESDIIPGQEFSITKLFPNPAGAQINIETFAWVQESVHFEIISITGQKYDEGFWISAKGSDVHTISLKPMPSGIYIFQLSGEKTKQSKLISVIH